MAYIWRNIGFFANALAVPFQVWLWSYGATDVPLFMLLIHGYWCGLLTPDLFKTA